MSFSHDPVWPAHALDGNFAVTTPGERIRSLKVGADVEVQIGLQLGVAMLVPFLPQPILSTSSS